MTTTILHSRVNTGDAHLWITIRRTSRGYTATVRTAGRRGFSWGTFRAPTIEALPESASPDYADPNRRDLHDIARVELRYVIRDMGTRP